MPNDVNKSNRFNIHTGGIETVCNNGNETIRMGDWVIAYAPTTEEIGRGGRKGEAEKNGLIKLWYKPYDPSIHRLNTKNIYECLSNIGHPDDVMNRTHHLNEFRSTCQEFLDSVMGMSMVTMQFLLGSMAADKTLLSASKQIKDAWGLNSTDESDSTVGLMGIFLRMMNHSSFTPDKNQIEFPEARQKYLDALFNLNATHFEDRQKNSKLFTTPSGRILSPEFRLLYNKMSRIQTDSVGLYLAASATFFHIIVNRIIGKAVTSADPGYDFDIQFAKYAM